MEEVNNIENTDTQEIDNGNDSTNNDNNVTDSSDNTTVETELLAGKYKNQEELIKGHESQTKYVQEIQAENKEFKKKTEVPEEYNFDYTDEEAGVSDADFSKANELFKEAGLTQAQASKLMDAFVDSHLDLEYPDSDQIKADLGDNATEIISDCQAFINRMPNVEDREKFISLANSAENFEWLHRVVVSPHKEKPMPSGTVAQTPQNSPSQLKSAADSFYWKNKEAITNGLDPNIRDEYESLMDRYIEAKNK